MLAAAPSNSSVVVCTILATSTAAADDLLSARIAARLRAAADSSVELIGAAVGDARPVEGNVVAAVMHDGEAGRFEVRPSDGARRAGKAAVPGAEAVPVSALGRRQLEDLPVAVPATRREPAHAATVPATSDAFARA